MSNVKHEKSPKAAKTTRPKTRRRKFGPKSPRLATNSTNPVPSGGETEKSDCGASSKEIRGHKHKITETVYQNLPWGKSVFAIKDSGIILACADGIFVGKKAILKYLRGNHD